MSGDYIIKLLSLKSVAIGNKKYTNFITKTAVDADLDNFVRRECITNHLPQDSDRYHEKTKQKKMTK